MNPPRGRPSKIAKSIIIDTLINHENEIIINGKIVSKMNVVWGIISDDLNGAVSPKSLYVIVTCNRFKIRDILFRNNVETCGNTINLPETMEVESDEPESDVSNFLNVSLEEHELDSRRFVVPVSRLAFMELVVDRTYKRRDQNKKSGSRTYKKLIPGNWQDFLTQTIWDATRIKCGFNFKNHYLTADAKSGYMKGMCNCGSKIRCDMNDINPNHININLEFTVTKGIGICGKRYLRAPIRQVVGKDLTHKAVHVYRAELADALMSLGDPEPPHLYTSSVLSVAKNEHLASQYLDIDPMKAIGMMKSSYLKQTIHNIGLDPFYVHYWTNHQLHMYRAFSNNFVAIDATGSIVKKIDKPNKSKGKHIFLYNAVLNCEAGQFAIIDMLSESHNTNAIQYWLMEWVRSGAPFPREVVTDFSRALLNAVIRTFTEYLTLEQYANACRGSTLPKCYVRIDVAHFIKLYASFLKTVPRLVKVFYLASIGKLVVSRSIEEARDIIKNILLTSQSETDGVLECGSESKCQTAKTNLEKLIRHVDVTIEKDTSSSKPKSTNINLNNLIEGVAIKCLVTEDDDSEIQLSDCDNHVIQVEQSNDALDEWSQWGAEICEEVQVALDEVGERPNAHYLPGFSKYLMNHVKLLPLWSNIIRDKFGYGRVPASSAAVEGEFNKIKTHLLKYETTPMRADVFIEKHVSYINGCTKIVDARAGLKKKTDNHEEIEIIACGQDNHIENLERGVETSERDESFPIFNTPPPITAGESCPACENNDEPSGAHSCAVCQKYVHALEQCSRPLIGEKEGHGERRLCLPCHNAKSGPQILVTREIDNWKGLAQSPKKKRRALYVGKNLQKVNDLLTFRQNQKLPILKNGSSMALQAIKMDIGNFSFIHTCAFDSIFQIMLAAICDWPRMRQKITQSATDNALLAMTIDCLEKGLRTMSYRNRALILNKIFSGEIDNTGWQLVDCRTNVGYLAGVLFKDNASYTEQSICNNGCAPRLKSFPVLQLDRAILFEENGSFEDIIQNKISLPGSRKCCTRGCTGAESTEIFSIGNIVLFDVFGVENDDKALQLQHLPTRFKNPLNHKQSYELIGIVHYEGPPMRTRLSESFIGHYTAIIPRRGGHWVQYDDQEENEKHLRKSFKSNPKLVVYMAETQ